MLKNDKKKPMDDDQTGVSGFGGYSTRHAFEKRRQRGRSLKLLGAIAVLVALLVFSVFGILALIRGDFSPKEDEGVDIGSIRVPTQSEMSENQREPEEMIAQVELSLITMEVPLAEGGYRYGTGFLVSEDGYAVCAASLFQNESGGRITAFTGAGFSTIAHKIAVEETLGVALVRLSDAFMYTPLPAENSSFVTRGQTLFVVPSQKGKLFYGTVTKALVASVGPTVSMPDEWGTSHVNMIYLDKEANASQYGAVVVDQGGSAVGFCTDAVAPPYPGLTSVVPIHSVYTLINDLLSEK